MREEIANLVHPVFHYGLRLKERLENGEELDRATEQAVLIGKLQSDLEARRHADYGGDVRPDASVSMSMSMAGRRPGSDGFLGIRYALACWLDEIFILDSPWAADWNEHKLEERLYNSNERAYLFWEQAKRAEARPGSDAMEVYFLCVMLGFRGDLRDEPDRLQAWVAATQTRIARGHGGEWPVPPELDAPINVPPLHGRDRVRRMFLVGGVAFLVLVPVLAFFVIRYLQP